MRQVCPATGPEQFVVGPSVRKAQISVWATPDLIGTFIVLPVVLPEANLADQERSPLAERFVSAARTADWQIFDPHVWGLT